MTRQQHTSYPGEWRAIALTDWHRVRIAVAPDDAALAGFLPRQSLEKFLKAYLLARNWRLRRTHELDALLNTATSFDSQLARFLDLCERVSGYYLAERYPFTGGAGITKPIDRPGPLRSQRTHYGPLP